MVSKQIITVSSLVATGKMVRNSKMPIPDFGLGGSTGAYRPLHKYKPETGFQ